jgi:hypothetical protein
MNKSLCLKIISFLILFTSIIINTLPCIMVYEYELSLYMPEFTFESIDSLVFYWAFSILFLLSNFVKSKISENILFVILLFLAVVYTVLAIIFLIGNSKEMYAGTGMIISISLLPLTLIYIYLRKKTNHNGC